MSAKYDEDIYENPFFVALQSQFDHVLNKAAQNGWIICVPQFCVASGHKVTPIDVEDHVLVPVRSSSPDADLCVFQSLSSKDVDFVGGKVNTGMGYELQQQVNILFEETFCGDNDESYRVMCLEHFLNAPPGSEVREESDRPSSVANYDQCLDLLWNHTGGWKTREHVDKVLNTFSASYEGLEKEGLRALVDVATTQYTKIMEILLKDSVVKRSAKHSKGYMDSLKLAVEMYLMKSVHKELFQVIAAVMSTADVELNKTTRNIAQLQLHDLGIRQSFSDNIKPAKKELAKLNSFSTPLGRLLCIKRVTSLLSRSSPTAGQSELSNSLMTTDDFLPLLIFLIIKSEIPNWNANFVYMSQFHFAKSDFEDEFAYYLASVEAALEHIKSGEIREEISGKDKLQGFGWTPGQVDGTVLQRQISGPSHPAVEDFFTFVQSGDEKAVQEMLEKPKKASEEIYLKLCHPLCSCEKCEKKQAETKTDSNLVTAYTRDNRGYTALHIAAKFGQAMLIDLLVQHGSVVDATDYLGLTPLLLACQRGFQNVMLLLLHFGANINAKDNDGNTPLHLSAANGHAECVKALVFYDSTSRRMNINCVNDVGDSALHLSAKWGYESIVKTLLDSGANTTMKNRKKQTPISLAQNMNIQKFLVVASRDHFELISPQPVSKPKVGMKGVHKTSSVQHFDDGIGESSGTSVVRVETVTLSPDYMKIQKTKDKLFRVIRDGDIQLVKYYLGFDEEEDERETEEDRNSDDICHPLCQCAKCHSVQQAVSRSSTGLTVNCTTSTFYTPLHLAALHKHADLVQLFLQKGANVNAETHKKMTPLHLSCCVRSAQSCMKLLECGAKVNMQDVNEDTPLHICGANGFIIGVFYLIEHKAKVNLLNKQGNTPLHECVERGYSSIAQHLLHSGARLDVVNKKGFTPVQLTKSKSIESLFESYSVGSERKISRTVSEPVTLSGHVGIQELFAAFETEDLQKLRNLSKAIRTFNRRDSLKRTHTLDLSMPHIRPLAHSLSIKHFDKSKLKHVDSFDKSDPIYSSLKNTNNDDELKSVIQNRTECKSEGFNENIDNHDFDYDSTSVSSQETDSNYVSEVPGIADRNNPLKHSRIKGMFREMSNFQTEAGASNFVPDLRTNNSPFEPRVSNYGDSEAPDVGPRVSNYGDSEAPDVGARVSNDGDSEAPNVGPRVSNSGDSEAPDVGAMISTLESSAYNSSFEERVNNSALEAREDNSALEPRRNDSFLEPRKIDSSIEARESNTTLEPTMNNSDLETRSDDSETKPEIEDCVDLAPICLTLPVSSISVPNNIDDVGGETADHLDTNR